MGTQTDYPPDPHGLVFLIGLYGSMWFLRLSIPRLDFCVQTLQIIRNRLRFGGDVLCADPT